MANTSRPPSSARMPSLWSGESSFMDLWRQMDRLFDDFTHGGVTAAAEAAFINPPVDIAEIDNGLEVKAELPGIDEKDIDVEYSDGVLTLRAQREFEKEDKDEKTRYHVMERSYGTFMRRLRLPFEPDPNKIKASFDKGVVTIHVPRPAGAKATSRKIAVETRH